MHINEGLVMTKSKPNKMKFKKIKKFLKAHEFESGSPLTHIVFVTTLTLSCLLMYLIILKLNT